jgi:rhodanese-related sulfurtransferase
MSNLFKTINREELLKLMNSGKPFKLIDVLSCEHFRQEHIKGAISLPLDEIEKKAHKILNKEDTAVVYCASLECTASTRAAEKLVSLGFKNVMDYKGGLKDYKEAGLTLEGNCYETASKRNKCGTC